MFDKKQFVERSRNKSGFKKVKIKMRRDIIYKLTCKKIFFRAIKQINVFSAFLFSFFCVENI